MNRIIRLELALSALLGWCEPLLRSGQLTRDQSAEFIELVQHIKQVTDERSEEV